MDINVDLSSIKGFYEQLDQALDEVRQKVDSIGTEADEYAKENGDYHDRTGRLRRSNTHEVDKDGSLILTNTAPYAKDMEARGYDVRSSSALFAEKRLKETFE